MTYRAPNEVLPHREPFIFIDEVLECTDTFIRATRTFGPEEDFFRGHFPGDPIVPGVILVEAMAQSFAYLCLLGDTASVYLTGIDRARFRQPVRPGETVEFRVHFEQERMGLLLASAEAYVGETKVAQARLTGAVNAQPPGEA